MDDTFSIAPNTPILKGRFRGGKVRMIKVNKPAEPPPSPTPVTARPTMNMDEVTAAALRIEPQRNIPVAITKRRFAEYSLYSLPQVNCNELDDRRYAVKYHPTSATVWK